MQHVVSEILVVNRRALTRREHLLRVERVDDVGAEHGAKIEGIVKDEIEPVGDDEVRGHEGEAREYVGERVEIAHRKRGVCVRGSPCCSPPLRSP